MLFQKVGTMQKKSRVRGLNENYQLRTAVNLNTCVQILVEFYEICCTRTFVRACRLVCSIFMFYRCHPVI